MAENKRCHWQVKDLLVSRFTVHTKKPTEVTVDFFTRGSNFFANFYLAVVSLPTCADNLCKQFGPRSGLTKCQALSGSKLLDILKELLENLDLEKKSADDKRA